VNRRKLILAAVVVVVGAVSAVLSSPEPDTQVIGSLAMDDLPNIHRAVRHELRWLLPQLTRDALLDPAYIFRFVREYHQKHILWVEVLERGKARAYVGVSKTAIRSNGHVFELEQSPQWHVTGGGAWELPLGAPEDMRVPQDN
jgi:hypothetical protein